MPNRTADLPCPTWCRRDHADDNPHGEQVGSRAHTAAVGGFWQREHRSENGRITRPSLGMLGMSVTQVAHPGDLRDDESIVIEFGLGELLILDVGEALRLRGLLGVACGLADTV